MEKDVSENIDQLSLIDDTLPSPSSILQNANSEIPKNSQDETEKKLAILVDGSSFIYRAFYALPQLTGASGNSVGAVYGFCSMLLSLMDKHSSDLFCVALDAGRETFRREIYPEYKNNREETPQELKSQFPILIQACKAFGIPIIELEKYEADDIIATLSDKLSKQNYEVRIIASDKDLMQLITENVYLFDPIKSKVIKENEVFEKYGVLPHQMTALQTLMGDKTDNVPGIEGIGPKTAAKLINQFGSIDDIYKNIEGVSSAKIKAKLIDQKNLLKISGKLVTLCKEVPLSCDFSQLKINFNADKAKNFLMENKFNSLIKRLEKRSLRIEKKQRKYVHIYNASNLKTFMDLNDPKKISIFSTSCFNGNQILIICTKRQTAGCFFRSKDSIEKNLISYQEIFSILKPYLDDENITKIGLKSCLKLFPEMKSFNDLAVIRYLLSGVVGDKIADLFQDNDSYICKFSFSEICNAEQACLLAELMFDEFDNFTEELKRNELFEIYKNIDMPILSILNDMENNGIMISEEKLKSLAEIIKEKIKNLEDKIFALAGCEFNIGSPKQLADLLFEKLKLPRPSKKSSVNEENLEELYDINPIPKLVVEWRKLSKLLSGYTYSLCDLRDPKTQRLHTSFHSISTITGRLSSSNPNLQNIPYRTELGREIRHAFISQKGFKLISFDYSQIELRILAHLANIKVLKEAFSQEMDVHKATAAQIFEVSMDDVTPEMRARAKTINFGIIYGMSPFRLSKNLGIDLEKAKKYIESYFAKFPEFNVFKESVLDFAKKNGYVKTITGRRCYIKDILSKNFVLRQFSERQAVNAVIQGTGADIVKIAMIKVYPELEKLHSSMLIQIHDELVFETRNDFVDESIKSIKTIMEQAYEISIPLEVNVEYNDYLS